MPPDRVFIIGGGGSGKTTIATRTGRTLGLTPVELDRDPARDRAEIARKDRWLVEGIFLYDIGDLLERADVILWLDIPRRVAQRRIVTRHARLSLLRRNRFPGVRNLMTFVRSMRLYYDKEPREPVSYNDWDALSRALTGQRLHAYLYKVRAVRSARELRRFRSAAGAERSLLAALRMPSRPARH